jgi:hypothetical protein
MHGAACRVNVEQTVSLLRDRKPRFYIKNFMFFVPFVVLIFPPGIFREKFTTIHTLHPDDLYQLILDSQNPFFYSSLTHIATMIKSFR